MKSIVKTIVLLAVGGLGLGLSSAYAQPGHEGHDHGQKSALPKCPVMDEPVNLAISVPSDEGPVFFCCEDCLPKYKADPGKYATKVAAQRKALADRAKVQVACPVSGEPVDQKFYTESDGQKVYFCCKGCVAKFQENPGKYKAGLANSYTYQIKCPVMGGDVDPQSFTKLADGGKIYYCCPGCEGPLFGNPTKHAEKLVAQGYKYDWSKIKKAGEKGSSGEPDHGGHDHGDHDGDHR